MAEKLVEISRGRIAESIFYGDVAVVNNAGRLLYSVGNPYKTTYFRSTAKPLQALNVVLSKAAGYFGFTPKEIAIMCASHYAEPDHLATVEGILAKIGLDKSFVLAGTVSSCNHNYALKLAWDHASLNSLYSDCSGKHGGMLAVCKYKSYSLGDYLNESHPCQVEIRNIIGTMCDIDPDHIIIGVDGCSAPVHAIPLYNMAIGYAKISNPETLETDMKSASELIFNAMVSHPEMIAGTGGFCTDLIRHTQGRLIGKIGADGVYCVGVRNENVGFSVKIQSGSMLVLPPVVMRLLKTFELLTAKEAAQLKKWEIIESLNAMEKTVGEIRAVF